MQTAVHTPTKPAQSCQKLTTYSVLDQQDDTFEACGMSELTTPPSQRGDVDLHDQYYSCYLGVSSTFFNQGRDDILTQSTSSMSGRSIESARG